MIFGTAFMFMLTGWTSINQIQRNAVSLRASRLEGEGVRLASTLDDFIPSGAYDIEEEAAQDMLREMQVADVDVPSFISDKPVPTTYVKLPSKKNGGKKKPLPLVFLHGFDSSLLEFRRIAPLAAEFTDMYAPDLLGWGFSCIDDVKDFEPKAKLEHLNCFLRQVVKGPCILCGASLGGAVGILMAADVCPELVEKLILIDGQGFIDGGGPSKLPRILAKLGVAVLKSKPLRQYANYASYTDKQRFATDDALKCGRAHCLKESWERASIDFVLSGGFTVSPFVSKVEQPTLVLWGEDDKILDVKFATQFESTLQSSTVHVLPDCGHVPHLEMPDKTANFIREFIV